MVDSAILELHMLLKVSFAALLGFMIGIERKGGKKGAGKRTFCLICMGSCLFTVLGTDGFSNNPEPARLAAQIVAGVGFIGAGVIWRHKEDMIHGITTAAAIWVSAAVGIATGLGFFLLSFVAALSTMFVLSHGHPIREAKQHLKTKKE